MTNLAVLPGDIGRPRLVEVPPPPLPGGGKLLVRMLYAPINPADLLTLDGRYAFAPSPDLPVGAEGVGVVEAVGEGVSDLTPGDRVLPLSRGNWCRYRILPRADVIALPPETDEVQAAMLRINPATARLLIDAACVKSGDVIVQNAAASAVAIWVRAITECRDIGVINVVRRPDHALPDAIVDGPDLVCNVRTVAQGRPIRAALDCVAGEASGRMAECLSPGGRLMVFGHLSGEPVTVRSQLLTGGDLSIHGFSLRPAEAVLTLADRDRMFADLFSQFAASQLRQPVREIMPLSQVEAAVALSRSGGRGRVLLDLKQ